MRIFLITGGVALALVAAGLFGVSQWLSSYVRSEAFRTVLSDATGKAFEAEAAFEPLRWTGASVYAESAKLSGRPTAALRELHASQLRAEVNWRAAFSGAWRLNELTIARLEGEWLPGGTRSAAVKPPPDNARSPSGIAAFLPKRFELGLLKIDAASLKIGEVQIQDSQLTITPESSGWLLHGTGGQLNLLHLAKMSIISFRAREQGGSFFLTEGNLRLGENGKVTVSGEFSDIRKVRLSWEGVKTSEVLTGEWRNRLDGTLSGTASMTFPGPAAGTFHLQDGRLENVPLLGIVAEFTGNPAFRKMPLQEVRGDFTRENGMVRIRNFTAESKGLLRLEGEATLGQQGEIAGRFQIGVTAQSLQWLPGSRERVFKTSRDGYVWTDLVLGGTMENPTENLSARLAAAMGGAVMERGTGLIKDAPGTAVEGARGILNLLTPFVP